MPLLRLAPLKVCRDAAGGVRIAAPPDRSPVVVRAATALTELTRRAGADGARPVDVQPVVQVCDPEAYARWRSGREVVWRAQGGRYTTASWPAALAPDEMAAVLLPLAAGAAARPGGKAPRVVADPLFSTGSRAKGAEAEDVALGLLAEWLRRSVPGPALRVAPPLLELVTAAGTGPRRGLDLGLDWPLAGA
ncbi:hypothetical protein FSW04_12540 [Baekduia soli]|uniref:Uncharacterized protein n=1 Tax=Baekduia soli TaxID=496014 RepID=A0A5B8U5U7_9ACTN|nr:hypothetical protein [Baekduia soli]QEC48311.1 hypothetical protein FSW04_12540 [Baekduia soli]